MTQDNRRHTSGPKSVSPKANTTGAEAKIKKAYRTKADLIARAKEAGIENPERLTSRGLLTQLKKLKKEGKIIDPRGGAREDAGRKPMEETERRKTATELFEVHMNEIVDIVIEDKKHGTFTTKKVSTLEAMLNTLRHKALKEKDVRAIVAYMDRVVGKPKQMVEHSGAIKQEEQRVPTDAERRAVKAFLAELDK